MDLRPQGGDIIRTWLFATLLRSHYEHGTLPWSDTTINGWILDPDRKKMSKSKGNVVTPVEYFDRFGSDAVRYWAQSGRPGVDTAFDEGQIKIGDRVVIPGGQAPHNVAKNAPKSLHQSPQPLAAPSAKAAAAGRAAAAASAKAAAPKALPAKGTPAPKQPDPQQAAVVTPSAETPAPTPIKADATPTFRWPVKGRVIAGFGPRPNGQQNDGINLALPEGTSVKAAEDGVVAYAGNELKGYGNLVLIRHDNGWVSAYAHADQILVKRDDVVKRGQVIAKAGKTGTVDQPQLHFELRQGAKPVDPMPHMEK